MFYKGDRKRRHRTIFSEVQLAGLERAFAATHYPDAGLREHLGRLTGLPEERIEVIHDEILILVSWYNNVASF